MIRLSLALFSLLAGFVPARGAAVLPFEEETLRYAVNWPSGLSLGEAQMRARRVKPAEGAAERWELEMTLEAGIPGFAVLDNFRSRTTPELCSTEFEKDSTHGQRRAHERTSFDPAARIATRQTLGGGGKAEIPIPACARDALAFLYYVRSQLASGRLPPAQTIFFGAPYEVRLEYGGRRTLRAAEAAIETDRILVTVKGPASKIAFEVFFGLDAARRPVVIRVPLQMGTFAMELVP